MKKYSLLFVSFLLSSLFVSAQVKVVNLLCENKPDPIGIDELKPRLSWQLEGPGKNISQTAYEVRVAVRSEDLTRGNQLTWSSGKIPTDQSVQISYGGSALKSDTKYYWQVRVWDNNLKISEWSTPATWQMGLLQPSDWKAKWITQGFAEDTINRPSPLLRKQFALSKKILSATAYITSHGLYEAHINNQRVGDAYLTPGWTNYNKRLQYQVYDVTNMVTAGTNAIGVSLGSGWFRGNLAWGGTKNIYGKELALLFQLIVRYTDGTAENILSDESWKSTYGPIVSSEIYHGEVYDARAEKKGWITAGFNDSEWKPVRVIDLPKNTLIATWNEPIRKHEQFKPVKIFRTPAGEQVVDFGQNLVGWVQLKVRGTAGDRIRIYHAEVLDKKGNFYTDNLRAAKQQDEYILSGEKEDVLEPHFTFQGFRYIKLENFPGELKAENLTAIALYSDMKPSGTLTTSHPLLNQLQHNIQWGQKGNFLDVPTDCPQRDERLGWTGDAQVFSRTAAYNMNVNNFFAKWLRDVAADQEPNGSVPFVVPNVLGPGAGGSAGWADVATIIPWNMWLAYGDKKILSDQFESMKAWVGFMEKNSTSDLWNKGFHFGDWLFYRPDDDNDGRSAITDKYLIAQCFYAHSTQLVINAAEVLGKDADVHYYTGLLQRIKSAFLKEYVTGSGRLVSSSQTAYVLALQFDMLPLEMRAQAAERLVKNIENYNNHLTTGFLGTPYLCHVLTRFGYSDVAYKLLLQETYPSWLYPVKMGATTIWERWDGQKPDSTFQTPNMNSFNHYAYGAIGDWMYRVVAGIDTDSSAVGYKKIIIHPHIGGGLTEVKASLNTYYGMIRSEWSVQGDGINLVVEIPANTTAKIYMGVKKNQQVTVNGKLMDAPVQGDFGPVDVGSGRYNFLIRTK
ncbi:MAG TPA: family 78 glycoside hydrolase catalytic domain [Flavitalea sp.]|nr:family 78 glycoside hydrolase catalytic domain [Flavitalea sp.]